MDDVEEVVVDFSFAAIYDFIEEVSKEELSELTEGQLIKVTGETAIYVGCFKGWVKFYMDENNFVRVEKHPQYMNGELLSIREFREAFISLIGDDVSEEIDSKLFQIYITEGNKDNGVQHSIQSSPKEDIIMFTEEQEAIIKQRIADAIAAAKEQPKAESPKEEPTAPTAAANDSMPIWKKAVIGVATVATVAAGGYAVYRKFGTAA